MKEGDLVWTPHPYRIQDEIDIGVILKVEDIPEAGLEYIHVHWLRAGETGIHLPETINKLEINLTNKD